MTGTKSVCFSPLACAWWLVAEYFLALAGLPRIVDVIRKMRAQVEAAVWGALRCNA
jgi:hypothetical protein